MKRLLNNRSGFTILETVIVLLIIGILASIVTQGLPFLREKTRDRQRVSDMDNLKKVLELYKTDTGAYPATDSGGGVYFTFITANDAFAGTLPMSQVTDTYVPGLVPNYYAKLPQDPYPGMSTVAGCAALGYQRTYVYFSNGEHYKLIQHCASETGDYPVDSTFYDPARPDWAWAASDDMNYTTFTLGW